MSNQPQAEEKHFVEEVGIFFERTGMPRMAGRILGWLVISARPIRPRWTDRGPLGQQRVYQHYHPPPHQGWTH